MIELTMFNITVWILLTGILAIVFYFSAILWIPHLMSERALKGIRKRAGTNVLIHRPPNTAENCRIPMAIADAMISICVFDISETPLRIHTYAPSQIYWSISCYARNTDNFFVLNDVEIQEMRRDQVTFILKTSNQNLQSSGDEVMINSPSETGIVLIRMIVPDPVHHKNVPETSAFRQQWVEEVDGVDNAGQIEKYRVDVFTPYDEIHVHICRSIKAIEQMIERIYGHRLNIALASKGKTVELPGEYRIIFDEAK